MLIEGRWAADTDGTIRPFFEAKIETPAGQVWKTSLVVDTGADRTVLSRRTFDRLGLTVDPATAAGPLAGVGGETGALRFKGALILTTAAQTRVTISGTYYAFADRDAGDMDLLGRDVLDLFHLIVSRPSDMVLLLGGSHGFQVVTT